MSPNTRIEIEKMIRSVYDLNDGFNFEGVEYNKPTGKQFEIDYFYLADSYLRIHNKTSNTEIYQAQEGFYRSAIPALVVFIFMCVVKLLISGPNYYFRTKFPEIALFLGILVAAGLIAVCIERTLFFNTKKNIHIFTQFYTLAKKELEEERKQSQINDNEQKGKISLIVINLKYGLPQKKQKK